MRAKKHKRRKKRVRRPMYHSLKTLALLLPGFERLLIKT